MKHLAQISTMYTGRAPPLCAHQYMRHEKKVAALGDKTLPFKIEMVDFPLSGVARAALSLMHGSDQFNVRVEFQIDGNCELSHPRIIDQSMAVRTDFANSSAAPI